MSNVVQQDPECLIFVDDFARTGQENMDLDARLLEHVCGHVDSPTICRLYRWSEPTVTLGYFQDLNAPVPESIQACPQVKRLTGGGAILHDREWTYSVVVPASHSIRHNPLRLYDVVHAVILGALRRQGVSCEMRKDSPAFQRPSDGQQPPAGMSRSEEPFLCFLRRDDRDIVDGVDKVVGSAQRRRKGNILQHGSILIQASKLLTSMPGLKDLHPEFSVDDFISHFTLAFGQALSGSRRCIRTGVEDRFLENFLDTGRVPS